MGKAKHRRQSGNFVMVLNAMQKSAAWVQLSGNAVKLLLHLMMLSEGNNGWGHKEQSGELFLSERDAAIAIGVSRNTASRAFAELIDHGFLRVVRRGHFQVKLKVATVWRLTFQPYPRNHQGPTNEWRAWHPVEKSRAQKLNGTGAEIAHSLEESRPTGAKTEPAKSRNGGKLRRADGSIIAPHLDMPRERGCSEPDNGCGWWGADSALRSRAASRLALLASLSCSVEKLSNNQTSTSQKRRAA